MRATHDSASLCVVPAWCNKERSPIPLVLLFRTNVELLLFFFHTCHRNFLQSMSTLVESSKTVVLLWGSQVYDTTAMEVVDSSLQGYNATVFAYGQTVRILFSSPRRSTTSQSSLHVSTDSRQSPSHGQGEPSLTIHATARRLS